MADGHSYLGQFGRVFRNIQDGVRHVLMNDLEGEMPELACFVPETQVLGLNIDPKHPMTADHVVPRTYVKAEIMLDHMEPCGRFIYFMV